ncbi:hypothetical protein [Archangium primigenium]|uniref:hypothetical protein n=1 Tax=[Archangium] primigenium TaxID=2792470 RepID=UPI0019599B01|nr:hypothetical protein [Archangium primigenium]MBM7119334.1 hypothetical protein [Archangium primigenium]
MFLPLLATLALLGQAPVPAGAPLTVLIAPPEAAGVPSHIVSFAQEHVAEQLKADGVQVIRASELSQGLPPAQRKQVLGCNRLEASCRVLLGEAAVADVVMIAELVQFLSGYRVGLKAYGTQTGELIAEHYVPGVKEDQLLDAFTQASEKVMGPVRKALRPGSQTPAQTPKTPVAQAPTLTPNTPAAPLAPPPGVDTARRSGGPGLAWLPAAGGVVLAGVGTVFVLQARQDYRALTTGDYEDPKAALAVKERGERKQLLGAASFALGAVGVVTTGLIYGLSGKGESKTEVHPVASVSGSGGMVGLAGTWH